MNITEHRVAEAIKSDFTFLTENPELLSLLALFQDRDDFNVVENKVIEPIKEDAFLENISKSIHDPNASPEFEGELAKERLGEVKNKVIEGLKGRWIKPGSNGRRDSIGSFASDKSKRCRESLETDPRNSRQRVASPPKKSF